MTDILSLGSLIPWISRFLLFSSPSSSCCSAAQDWRLDFRNVRFQPKMLCLGIVFVFTHTDPFHILPLPLVQEKVQLDGTATWQFGRSRHGCFSKPSINYSGSCFMTDCLTWLTDSEYFVMPQNKVIYNDDLKIRKCITVRILKYVCIFVWDTTSMIPCDMVQSATILRRATTCNFYSCDNCLVDMYNTSLKQKHLNVRLSSESC